MTGPPVLHPDLLSRLTGCALPGYDRRAATAGVVHVGLGAFARGHVARYCDDLLALGDPHAAIAGASLVSGATTRALAPQDGLYTLIETDGRDARLRVVGSVTRSAEGPEATVDALAQPSTVAVTLTITEKGYHRDPVRGGLAVDDPAVAHDLARPGAPRTAPGVLVAGLRQRREQGGAGLAVVSCDNLIGNGEVTAAVVTDLAAAHDPDLAHWIADHVAFPSTVVDRIVPATTDADRRLVVDRLGVRDAAPVLAEPYCSWAVETAPGLPRWDRVGATFVADVAPWQRRKLRLVNGLHSALAYLGALAGHATVDAAVGDPALAAFVRVLATDEIAPTLEPPPAAALADRGAADHRDVDHGDVEATLERFANPALGHRTRQVAADGSQKLRPRLVGTIADRRAAGAPVDRLALVVAAWMAWVAHCSRGGDRLDDPLAPVLTSRVRAAGSSTDALAGALFGITAVFDPGVADDDTVRAAVTRALSLIASRGAAGAAEALT